MSLSVLPLGKGAVRFQTYNFSGVCLGYQLAEEDIPSRLRHMVGLCGLLTATKPVMLTLMLHIVEESVNCGKNDLRA